MKSVPDDERTESLSRIRGRGRIGVLALATSVALAAGTLAAVPAAAEETPAPAVETPAPAPESTPAPTHTIAQVQGTTDVSPLVGQTVTVQGVVTADYRTGGFKGFVIQTQGTGGGVKTPGASDGIFVYLGSQAPTLAIGDLVSVTGKVSEYSGQTQISPSAVTDTVVVTAGVGVPAPTPLPDTVVGADREQYENMLVAPTGTYRLASSHQLYNYGTLWLNAGEELNVKSTETTRPGDAATAIAKANRANRILLDDGWSTMVTTKPAHPGDQPYFTKDTVVRNGDKVGFPAEGSILQYGFDDWRLQPIVPIDDRSAASHKPTFTALNPRPATAPAVGGDVQVASFNVYNYFTTLTSENSSARGAATAEQFAIQKSKIVAAINGLDAEIVSLMEIENGPKLGKPLDAALADLVAGLNQAAGSEVWDYVRTPKALDTPAITDYITSVIIYKKAAATPKGDSVTVVDETVWGNAREPIAQTFQVGGKVVTVVANHLKSKTPPKNAGPEPADGQGFFSADRVAQAKAILAFTEQLKTSSGSDDILLIGDFNAYGKEDPIDVFAQAGWTDLVPAKAPGQYTYSFDGELGSLDHVIASPSLASAITGTGVWGINSPEWSDRGYAYGAAEAGTPFRSSDHDSILVGLSTKAAPVDINIVTVNDFHGRIEADGAAAGAAVLAGAVQQVRAANPNTIFAAAGDLIGASTFTSFIQDDNPTIDALNAAGLEVSAAGNHEFDQGWADLRDRVQPRADWEYLSANVFLAETGKPAMAPSWVKDVQGVKVGFIGAVTEDLDTLVSPDGMKGLEVRSIAESVNRVAADLKDGDPSNGEADVIILLVHEGATTTNVFSITPDSALGRIVYNVTPQVNAIVSAHTHLAYNHVIDGRPVVSASQYGENFGLMSLKVDPATKKLLSITNEIKPLTDKDKKPLYPAVPAVQKIVDEAKKKADELGGRQVGTITADFNRARQSDGKTKNRGGESTIGNFVADVHQWATGADLALMNPGGIRANLVYASSGAGDPDGNVTYREAATVQPFANTLVTLKLTGAQIKSVLEEQWQPDGAARPFLKLGVSKGLSYTYDPTAGRGARVTSITLNGAPIDPAATYTVAANSFLAAGGDAFYTFAQGTDKKDTGKSDLQSTVDWFAAHKTATPDLAQRAVGVTVSPAAGAEGYKAGDTVTVSLSSLAFSAGENAPGEVTLTLDGRTVATSPVDPTVIDASDEAGRATLTFTVPAGLSGAQTLTATVAGTGTTARIPLSLAGVPAPGGTISLGLSTVIAGNAVVVSGTGFDPGVELALELRSTPVALGKVTTGADGSFSAVVSIPKDTPAGTHTVAAVRPDGSAATAELTVTAAGSGAGGSGAGGSGAGGSAGGTTGTGVLAVTGAEAGPYALIAALLLFVGLGLVAARRRARVE